MTPEEIVDAFSKLSTDDQATVLSQLQPADAVDVGLTDPPVMEPPVDDTKTLQVQLDAVTNERDSLVTERDDLQASLSTLQDDHQEAVAERDTLLTWARKAKLLLAEAPEF